MLNATNANERPKDLPSRLKKLLQFRETGVFIALAVIVIGFSIATPDFLTINNIIAIALRISQYAIMACGMTMIIISGEIDLSVGAFFGLASALIARMVKTGINVWIAFLIVLFIGAVSGAITGVITTKIRVPSFIVTLGLLNIFKTLTLIVTGAWVISGFDGEMTFFKIFSGEINIFPVEIIWMIVILVISSIILNRSVYGYNLFATGGNKVAASLSGVDTDRIKIIAFIISSVLVALTGAIGFSHITSASPEGGVGRELDIIAGVIVGGTNLFGGVGTIFGTFLGVAIIGVIRNGLVMAGIQSYWHSFFIGLIIIVAVIINTLLERKKDSN